MLPVVSYQRFCPKGCFPLSAQTSPCCHGGLLVCIREQAQVAGARCHVATDACVWCAPQFLTFVFFACCVALMTGIIAALLPETKGLPIEEADRLFEGHWVWQRVVGHKRQAEGVQQV